MGWRAANGDQKWSGTSYLYRGKLDFTLRNEFRLTMSGTGADAVRQLIHLESYRQC